MIGIDLGTTNSALAYAEVHADADPFAPANVQLMGIPQLVNPGEVRDEDLLPSFLYLPGAADFPPGTIALPWDEASRFVTGRLAQKRGVENAGRLVSSAKSWLSHSGVDRTAALLPFRAPEGVEKISPLEATRRYLEYLRHAWDAKMPDAPFAGATGPGHRAGFLRRRGARVDARSRQTSRLRKYHTARRAASRVLRLGGASCRTGASASAVGDLILVVDIGGGTTDFTLIAVTESGGELALTRVAVGEHILLGGDNIDLALASVVAERLAQKGTRIDSRQLQALWNNCRAAKEKLLEPGSKAKEQAVTILGMGTGLVGGTIKATLLREDIDRVLGEGFLPDVPSTEMPVLQRRAGLQEIGLPYAADPAITRQLARFLRQQAATSQHGAVRRGPSGLACPTHVLFNGGVLNAALVRQRITGALDSWLAEEGMDPVKPLAGEDLMHAVSRGAAYYGLARCGRGVRIRGGVPRTYYVGIESSMPSIPGFPAPLKALTVVPFGMEEGTDTRIPGPEFGLLVGAPGGVPLLHFHRAQGRPAGRPDRRFRRRVAGAVPHGSEFPGRRERLRSSAGFLRERGHRDRRAATLVRGPRRPAVEAGVQSEGEGGSIGEAC